ncbi:MAG: TRAP transporter substrate-binding protein DctP [Hyphomicrobiales bacterium]|nr:TRAP transporter substrate-binding protein DctP [Hyphomicrobiales bacterium]
MDRRKFLRTAGATGVTVGAVGAVAAPAIAQSSPSLKWRITSGFPKSLDTIYGASETIAKYMKEMTDGRFEIQPFGAGEIVPGLESVNAVSSGTVEMSSTAAFYNFGRDPTWALGTSVPFLMNQRGLDSWWMEAGGQQLLNEFFAKHNVIAFPGGNTGTQMGGWFRKEIKTVADLQGLKMRIGGLSGRVIQRVGVVPQQIAGGEIYPALERGTIDAAEWVGAYDDERLGFQKVAKFLYYPGWQEGGSTLTTMINLAKWNELPKNYQSMLVAASHIANTEMMAKYDARNAAALKRLIAGGTQLRAFPQEVLDAAFKAATDTYAEISAQNADFKKIYDHAVAFRNEFYLYQQIADFSFDSMIIRATRARA